MPHAHTIFFTRVFEVKIVFYFNLHGLQMTWNGIPHFTIENAIFFFLLCKKMLGVLNATKLVSNHDTRLRLQDDTKFEFGIMALESRVISNDFSLERFLCDE